jgi:hypothetical protein
LITEYFSVKLFTLKRNLGFMSTLSHKAAVASLCTALGFVLGQSPEAKAASFFFTPTTAFSILDGGRSAPFDGLGDVELFGGQIEEMDIQSFGNILKGTEGEAASLAEFNIGSFSLAPNEFISRAVFQTVINKYILMAGLGVEVGIKPSSFGTFGYVRNGTSEVSDFEAGVFLSSVDVGSTEPRM